MEMLSNIDNYLFNKFGKREKMDINQYIIKYRTIWAIIFFLNIEDAFVTLVAVRNLGTRELNPIMNILLSSPPGFIIAKMVLLCILFAIVYTYLSHFGKVHMISCWYIILFFTLIDINNIAHVILKYMMLFGG